MYVAIQDFVYVNKTVYYYIFNSSEMPLLSHSSGSSLEATREWVYSLEETKAENVVCLVQGSILAITSIRLVICTIRISKDLDNHKYTQDNNYP